MPFRQVFSFAHKRPNIERTVRRGVATHLDVTIYQLTVVYDDANTSSASSASSASSTSSALPPPPSSSPLSSDSRKRSRAAPLAAPPASETVAVHPADCTEALHGVVALGGKVARIECETDGLSALALFLMVDVDALGSGYFPAEEHMINLCKAVWREARVPLLEKQVEGGGKGNDTSYAGGKEGNMLLYVGGKEGNMLYAAGKEGNMLYAGGRVRNTRTSSKQYQTEYPEDSNSRFEEQGYSYRRNSRPPLPLPPPGWNAELPLFAHQQSTVAWMIGIEDSIPRSIRYARV